MRTNKSMESIINDIVVPMTIDMSPIREDHSLTEALLITSVEEAIAELEPQRVHDILAPYNDVINRLIERDRPAKEKVVEITTSNELEMF